MKRVNVSHLGKFLILFGIILAMTFSVGSAVMLLADGLIIDRTQSSFVEGNYRYYHISGDATGVAVAWGNNKIYDGYIEENSSVTRTSWSDGNTTGAADSGSGVIRIDPTVTHGGNQYTVKAVAPSGFRRTGFSEIRLPETITKIGEEAFHACESLTSFVIPCQVSEIAPSTFMDCRNLENVYYSACNAGDATNVALSTTKWKYWYNGSAEGYQVSNGTITSIGDHAFTSCINLKTFSFPTALTNVGKAAFQDCRAFTYIMFVRSSEHSTKNIVIGEYAFGDCISMTLFFFANNVSNVGAYAFARCDRLTLYYAGNTGDTNGYETDWRVKHPDTNKRDSTNDYVPFRTDYSDISQDPNYPGLYFVTATANITLDQWTVANKRPTLFDASKDTTYNKTYAAILSFATPTESTTLTDGYQYYNASTGKLMIPNLVQVGGEGNAIPVRVIEQNAFLGNTDLKKIKFNSNLIQICRYAFYGCSNIDELDFSAATGLKEISYKVFQDETIEGNTKLESLTLPLNLVIVGAQAFYNFRAVKTFSIPSNSQLQNIGQQAFAYLGAGIEEKGTVDLVLPNTLKDGTSNDYKPYRLPSLSADNDNAVMRQAFYGAKALRTVTVAWKTGNTPKDNDNNSWKPLRMGFGSDCFTNCTSLVRFTSNRFLYLMGYKMFSGCSSLRELFLCNQGARTSTWSGYPWGIKDGNEAWGGVLFNASTSPDVAIYIVDYDNNTQSVKTSPATMPRSNGNPQTNGDLWNSNPHIISAYTGLDDKNTFRVYPTYPTYLDVNWTAGEISYRPIDNASVVYNSTQVLDHLDEPMYSFKGGKLLRVYCPSPQTTMDLSAHTTITEIGDGAFAYGDDDQTNTPGTKIVLPTSVTTIGAYAFARTDSHSLDYVTYKDNGNPVEPSDTSTYSTYCYLHSNVTNIGRFAFYNHKFEYVSIGGDLTFLGTSAFLGESIVLNLATNTHNLGIANNMIFYNLPAQKTLLYLYSYAGTGTLDLSGTSTIAIAPRALVKSKYSTISLPTSLKTIYGGAMFKNTSVTTITVPENSNLTVIGSVKKLPDQSGAFSGLPFDLIDKNAGYGNLDFYEFSSSTGAFFGCNKLKTFNFRNAKNTLKKIGASSFRGCSVLQHMAGSSGEYKYYKIQNSNPALSSTKNVGTDDKDGVLDLSDFSALTSIGREAFSGCSKITYAHLPIGNSSLYLGKDPEEANTTSVKPFPDATKVLFGESAAVASKRSSEQVIDRYPIDVVKEESSYYYAEYDEDLLDNTGLKYWTPYSDGYLLFENRSEAVNYLDNRPAEP